MGIVYPLKLREIKSIRFMSQYGDPLFAILPSLTVDLKLSVLN